VAWLARYSASAASMLACLDAVGLVASSHEVLLGLLEAKLRARAGLSLSLRLGERLKRPSPDFCVAANFSMSFSCVCVFVRVCVGVSSVREKVVLERYYATNNIQHKT
jgi:hypothetical protein